MPPATGLVTSRAPDVLREQLALERGCGLVVETVAPGTPAAKAGLKRHDVLVALDGQLLLLPEQLSALLESSHSTAPLRFEVLRGGRACSASLHGAVGVTSAVETGTHAEAEPAAIGAPAKPYHPVAQATAEEAAVDSPPEAPSDTVTRLADDTLVQHDPDYWLKLHRGEETWLTVRDARGWVVFNGVIDTPAQRSLIPIQVLGRVEQLETMLDAPAYHPPHSAAAGVMPLQTSRSVRPAPGTGATARKTKTPSSRLSLQAETLLRPADAVGATAGSGAEPPPAGPQAPPPAAEIGLLDVSPIEIR